MSRAAAMLRPAREADPSFEPAWQELVAEWGGDAEVLLYPALSRLARHMVDDLEAGRTDRFDTVFDVVERWHRDPDPIIREAASVGLLEDLQNRHLYRSGKPSDFEPWLRALSREAWRAIDEAWQRGPPQRDGR